jgi:hypothetical protein
MDVQVFSDAPFVELFLNGKSLGKKPNPAFNYTNFEDVEYAPGNLTAVGTSGAWPDTPTHTILTAGVPHAIVLSLDVPSVMTGTGSTLLLDGHDAALVRATVVDAAGTYIYMLLCCFVAYW